MALTRDFKDTVVARVQGEPAFAQALLDETMTRWARLKCAQTPGIGSTCRAD